MHYVINVITGHVLVAPASYALGREAAINNIQLVVEQRDAIITILYQLPEAEFIRDDLLCIFFYALLQFGILSRFEVFTFLSIRNITDDLCKTGQAAVIIINGSVGNISPKFAAVLSYAPALIVV